MNEHLKNLEDIILNTQALGDAAPFGFFNSKEATFRFQDNRRQPLADEIREKIKTYLKNNSIEVPLYITTDVGDGDGIGRSIISLSFRLTHRFFIPGE